MCFILIGTDTSEKYTKEIKTGNEQICGYYLKYIFFIIALFKINSTIISTF